MKSPRHFHPRLWLGTGMLTLSLGLIWHLSSATKEDAAQVALQAQEAQRQQALAKLNGIRKEAAGDFAKLGTRHEAAARLRLQTTVHETTAAAKHRVPGYASWLLSYEASWEMLKAWKHHEIPAMLARESEKRMLSREAVSASLGAEDRRLNDELGKEAETLSGQYDNRVASVLALLDEPVRAQLPEFGFGKVTRAQFSNPVIQANLAGIGNFVGSSLVLSYGIERFVQWLGPKIAMKGASKLVRVGSGPVGWVIGLAGGIAIEKAIDETVIKPRLVAELNSQLDQVEACLIAKNGPCDSIAKEQARRARKISETLAVPMAARVATKTPTTTK